MSLGDEGDGGQRGRRRKAGEVHSGVICISSAIPVGGWGEGIKSAKEPKYYFPYTPHNYRLFPAYLFIFPCTLRPRVEDIILFAIYCFFPN